MKKDTTNLLIVLAIGFLVLNSGMFSVVPQIESEQPSVTVTESLGRKDIGESLGQSCPPSQQIKGDDFTIFYNSRDLGIGVDDCEHQFQTVYNPTGQLGNDVITDKQLVAQPNVFMKFVDLRNCRFDFIDIPFVGKNLNGFNCEYEVHMDVKPEYGGDERYCGDGIISLWADEACDTAVNNWAANPFGSVDNVGGTCLAGCERFAPTPDLEPVPDVGTTDPSDPAPIPGDSCGNPAVCDVGDLERGCSECIVTIDPTPPTVTTPSDPEPETTTTTTTTTTTEAEAVCGNGIEEAGEECDGLDGVVAGTQCNQVCDLVLTSTTQKTFVCAENGVTYGSFELYKAGCVESDDGGFDLTDFTSILEENFLLIGGLLVVVLFFGTKKSGGGGDYFGGPGSGF